jgi:hypothetical protein
VKSHILSKQVEKATWDSSRNLEFLLRDKEKMEEKINMLIFG